MAYTKSLKLEHVSIAVNTRKEALQTFRAAQLSSEMFDITYLNVFGQTQLLNVKAPLIDYFTVDFHDIR